MPEILKGSESEWRMTREEAIKLFRKEIECLSHDKCSDCILEKVCDPSKTPFDSEYIDAFGVAIEALSAEPCEDAISRQAVDDAIYDYSRSCDVNYGQIMEYIDKIPSVTSKQKMGRWIREKKHHKDGFQEFDYWDVRCSECGARKRIGWTNIRHCPMCGVKMESED